MRAKYVNEVKQDKPSSLDVVGIGGSKVFPLLMKRLIKEYNLYYLTNFDPDKVYDEETQYQFFSKICKILKCSIKDIILVDLDEDEKSIIKNEIKSTAVDSIIEYDDVILDKYTYHIQASENFAIIENTTKNSFEGDCIAVNNTKYKFFL